jgi:hypothetical protein
MPLSRAAGTTPGSGAPVADTDRRPGLPPEAAERIAAALLELAPPTSRVVLELGAGAGELGARLAAAGADYVGLDLSLTMLDAFRRRLAGHCRAGRRALLARADGDRPWPVARGRAGLIFLLRAAHRFDPEHLAEASLRAAHPGGAVLALGRLRRDPRSARATLRRQMRLFLEERGVAVRNGEQSHLWLAASLAERGAVAAPPRSVAPWRVVERPSDALAAWRAKPGLAGVDLPAAVKDAVLARLEAWARARWGDLEAPRECQEGYEILALRLPRSSAREAR